jgi:hypothetical protein
MSDNQSTVAFDLPPPPEDAYIQPSKSTGFHSISHTRRQYPRNRKRERAVHNIIQRSSTQVTDGFFTYFQKEAKRHFDAQCVFLLWGSEYSEKSTASAVDVRILNSDAEDVVFQELKATYYANRGRWRKYLSLRDVAVVRPVRVCCTSTVICCDLLILLEQVSFCYKVLRPLLSFYYVFRSRRNSPKLHTTAGNCRRSY